MEIEKITWEHMELNKAMESIEIEGEKARIMRLIEKSRIMLADTTSWMTMPRSGSPTCTKTSTRSRKSFNSTDLSTIYELLIFLS